MSKKRSKQDAILKMQFHMAMNGNIEMLKWLGIQYCEQDNKPSKADEQLPNGFSISRIPNAYEQEAVQEYEKYKEEFLKWQEGKNDVINL